LNQGQRKTNVLVVAAGLGIGGAEVVIQKLVQSLDANRFNVTICCIKMLGPIGEALAAAGHEIVVLARPGRKQSVYLAFLELLKLIRQRRIDIVHTHTTDALFDAALCRLVHRRVRLIHTFHFGNYPHRHGSRKWFEKIGSRFADRLIAVGDTQRQQVMAAYGFRPERIQRIWNGVSKAPASDGAEFRQSIRAENRTVIGVTATMIEQKGLFDFLQVAGKLRDLGDSVRFVIVGEGELRPRLEEMRRSLGLEDSVVFTGWLPHANEFALPGFDVFFQPSLWEAMSIALLEAMAAGKAVVATAVGEAPRIVEHGIDGFLVEPRDVAGMEKALRRLISQPMLRRRIGLAALAKVSERFTVDRMTRDYEQVYLEMIQGNPSSR
jgi:glycosyltransferase involved in cell wall biosynthesis